MKRTLKTLMVLATVAGLASAANAATISLSVDDGNNAYAGVNPGDTITITTTASTTGLETGATGIGGKLTYNDVFVNVNAALNQQFAVTGWTSLLGSLTCSSIRCIAFEQTHNPPAAVPPALGPFTLAQTRFIIDPLTPVGTVLTFNWQTAPTTQRLNFFGITGGPGISVTVTAIPEPTTAAMLGLGLFGLALAGRRRS